MTQTVRVELGERSYDIAIGDNVLARADAWITPVLPQKRVIIVSDEQVAPLHLNTLETALDRAHIKHSAIVLPAGEGSKSFATLEELLNTLLSQRPDRKTTLIALGGGVIGDLAGFAASILMRGVPFIQVPTTLLAQVDSSVGGKTGINTSYGKNLVGSFYQPKLVLADTKVLSSLPLRQRQAGYAEIVKYGLINDLEFFNWLENNGKTVLEGEEAAVAYAVSRSCEHKAAIVRADEREGGKRALLNLGHTFGHALEAETGFGSELLHGEAVALGMVLAFQLSEQLGLCPKEDVERTIRHLQEVGLPTRLQDVRKSWNTQALIEHFALDKKAEAGKLTFILARGIGKSFITQDVGHDELVNLLDAAARM